MQAPEVHPASMGVPLRCHHWASVSTEAGGRGCSSGSSFLEGPMEGGRCLCGGQPSADVLSGHLLDEAPAWAGNSHRVNRATSTSIGLGFPLVGSFGWPALHEATRACRPHRVPVPPPRANYAFSNSPLGRVSGALGAHEGVAGPILTGPC